MRIGVVAAEAAFATFARNIDVERLADGDVDFEGSVGPAEWPLFSLVIDTLAAADPGDDRPLDERRVDALNDLARLCLAVKGRAVTSPDTGPGTGPAVGPAAGPETGGVTTP